MPPTRRGTCAGCLLELPSFRTFYCVWRNSSLQSGWSISSSFSLKVLRSCFPNPLATGTRPAHARHGLRASDSEGERRGLPAAPRPSSSKYRKARSRWRNSAARTAASKVQRGRGRSHASRRRDRGASVKAGTRPSQQIRVFPNIQCNELRPLTWPVSLCCLRTGTLTPWTFAGEGGRGGVRSASPRNFCQARHSIKGNCPDRKWNTGSSECSTTEAPAPTFADTPYGRTPSRPRSPAPESSSYPEYDM